MWLITTIGFFSVVQKPGETDLTVRARVAADLDRLRERYMPALSPTTESSWSDYRFRARISHADYAAGLAKLGADIDYDNFKNAVARTDKHRAKVYGKVWTVLYDLQNKADR
jgi:hypothetical protein